MDIMALFIALIMHIFAGQTPTTPAPAPVVAVSQAPAATQTVPVEKPEVAVSPKVAVPTHSQKADLPKPKVVAAPSTAVAAPSTEVQPQLPTEIIGRAIECSDGTVGHVIDANGNTDCKPSNYGSTAAPSTYVNPGQWLDTPIPDNVQGMLPDEHKGQGVG